ncbi:hypothetical protein BH10PSE12_BH10PSE12_32830 [soil metagenome]
MGTWKAIAQATVAMALTGALTGCGPAEQAAPVAEDTPILLKAGQWTLNRTLTGYNTATVTAAEYAAKVGQKSTESVCIAIDAKGMPDPDALAGSDGKDCTYKEPSIRKGRFIATLLCKAGTGTSELLLEGNYTPESLTLGGSTTKTVDGNAVLRTTQDLTGKRTGDCVPDKPK